MKKTTVSETEIQRFNAFRIIIHRELGERVSLTHDGRVIVAAGPFSSACEFHSLQAALDSYARFLPQALVHGMLGAKQVV